MMQGKSFPISCPSLRLRAIREEAQGHLHRACTHVYLLLTQAIEAVVDIFI